MTRSAENLETYARRKLIERQRSLVERRSSIDREAQTLYEQREPDWEDRAADVTAAETLERLGDNEGVQLARVTDALARLEAGTWGTCVACGKPIATRRLRAVPEATRCGRCTNHQ